MNVLSVGASTVSQQTKPAKRRLDYIDALRGAACLWVLMHHTFSSMPAPNGLLHYPVIAFTNFCSIGWLRVSLFLVLSGFCLFYPFVARGSLSEIRVNILTFARRRAMRILPPYYAALVLLSVLEIAVNHHHGGHWDSGHWDWHGVLHGRKDILAHLFMLHNLWPDSIASVSPAFWSLALECQLYVIFPLLVWMATRFGLKSILVATFAISLGWQMFCYSHLGFAADWTPKLAVYYHALPGRCFEFAAGMTAAYFVACPRAGQSRTALAVILVPLLSALYFVLEVSRFGPLCDQVWGAIFASSLLLLGQVPDARFQSHPALRGLVWIGAISYSVYLMHGPLISVLSPHFLHIPDSLSHSYVIGLARIPLIIGMCYLFHLVFERPFMPGRPRTERQAEVAPALSPAP